MKAAIVQVKTFAEDTPADLDTAVLAFLETLGEGEYLALTFAVSSVPKYCAQLTYAR